MEIWRKKRGKAILDILEKVVQVLHFLIFPGRILKSLALLSWDVNSCNPSLPFKRQRSQDVRTKFFVIQYKSHHFPCYTMHTHSIILVKLNGITTVQFQEGAVGSVRVSYLGP